MTNEEAVRKLEYSKTAYQMLIDEKVDSGKLVGKDVKGEWKADTPLDEAYKSMIEALEMGIKAIKALEQEPCEDAIDRKLVCAFIAGLISDDGERGRGLEYIRSMPPVNPQPKTGHWEQYGNFWEDKFKCSECGKEQPKILCGERIIGHWSDYCPNCGCRMVEPQESEDT